MLDEESRNPDTEQQDTVPILPGEMVDSEVLRRWLLPHIFAKKQTEAGKWLGLAQSTINRIVKQDAYDFPLNTVVKIAEANGYKRLSEFFLALETGRADLPDSVRKMTDAGVNISAQSDHLRSDTARPHLTVEVQAHGVGRSLPARRLEDILTHISEAIGERAALLADDRANRRLERLDTKARRARKKKPRKN